MGIVLIVGLAIVLMIIRRLIYAGVYKGVDAAENAIKRSREQKNPPKKENLADRYNQNERKG